MDLVGQKFLVVGLGKSGEAAVRLLRQHGAHVIGNDARTADELSEVARRVHATGAELALGGHASELFTSVDHIVLSPGVPSLPALEAAQGAGIPIVSEIELASWFIQSRLVGITGTNGKSTVTSMVGEICQRSGRPTFVGGNLGTPLIDVVGTQAAKPGGYAVVELSSYQLERVDRLRVNVAALLNLSPDHLDRYTGFEAYAAAKARIFEGQQAQDACVVAANDERCSQLAARSAAPVHGFGSPDGEVRLEAGHIVDARTELRVPAAELNVHGSHNIDNACAAALIARLAGVDSEHIAAGLCAFEGLPHRLALIRDLDGVRYYDDSKATNVGATASALDGLAHGDGRIVLIAGGRHKGASYDPIVPRMQKLGRAVVTLGEAAHLIEAALAGSGVTVQRVDSMAAAAALARDCARPGDAILLSPACSSFDMFDTYAHRGDVFAAAVRALPGEDA